MHEIEAFAEVGEYFDQPVRTYSSGMQMRVAFSVATAFKPDLLIVDEALSVGDSYFQHKSFDRIRQFRNEGVSIMLVTHSMSDVRTLCDRVILLDKGKVIKDGLPDEVVDYYNALIAEKENTKLSIDQLRSKNGWLVTSSGSKEAELISLKLVDAFSEKELTMVAVGQKIAIVFEVLINRPIPRLVMGILLRDRSGHVVWGTNTWHTKQQMENLLFGQIVQYRFEFECNLGQGSYSLTYNLVSSDTRHINNFESIDNFFVFDVVNINLPTFAGTCHLNVNIGCVVK
jgi:lipopolysaccharide transport system ATP-binding protein